MISLSKTTKILGIAIMVLFIFSTLSVAGGLTNVTVPDVISEDKFESQDHDNGIDRDFLNPDINGKMNESTDVGQILSDNEQTYNKIWDPWLTKGAIHAIATSKDGEFMALASGYLYDDQVHLYRWNYETNMYDLVWEVGGGVFKSDVTSLAIADTDYNNLTEIIAGGEDGRIYVFEQRFLYDPITNTENMFDLVWESPRLGRIFSLTVDDTDRDFRKDIIVGTGDTVRWFEYDTHANYPFSKEHWIEFKEVFSYQLPSQVTALTVSDLDADGLKEVAVGMKSGEIQLLENAGESIEINGELFPIAQDNTYRSVWSNGNFIRRAISDMSAGNLDDDSQLEILVAVQGQGAYILDNYNGEVVHYRLQRPYQQWEANPIEKYPLDYYADSMVTSSSLDNGSYVANPNVYYRNGTTNGKFAEPLNYTGSYFDVYPYSSASVMKPDGKVTVFDATTRPAWAIYDMGQDEEGASNGVPGLWDIQAVFSSKLISTTIKFAISVDGVNWVDIDSSNVTLSGLSYEVDLDYALANMSSIYYRYFMINVTSGKLDVDYIYTPYINNPIYDALSTEAGPLMLKGESSPRDVGFIATIDGTILAVGWNTTTGAYEILWDSWNEERYKLGTNVFDLEMVKHRSRFPSWMDLGAMSFTKDMSFLPDGGKMVSYSAENFYEYRTGASTEFIVSSSSGNLFVYEQGGKYSAPQYNQLLTDMLFSVSDSLTVNQYILQKKSEGAKYFTTSLIPIETRFASQYNDQGTQNGVNKYIDPIINGYWLLIGSWDGYVSSYNTGGITDNPYVNDIAVFYLTQVPKSYSSAPVACDTYPFETCAYFSPLLNSSSGIQTLKKLEMTGSLESVFRQSSWMLKASAGDFIGSKFADIVTTNGGLQLLEVIYAQDNEKLSEEEWVNPSKDFVQQYYGTTLDQIARASAGLSVKGVTMADAIDKEFSDFKVVLRGDYFKTINEDSKGRKWTNANPVDFDGDGDMDLILGFARYEDTYFGFNKTKYGVTYWENQGTREEPIWVELSKGVNNNDPSSNFQHGRWTDPVLVWNDYVFPDGEEFDPILGYHPLYKSKSPSVMYMFQQAGPTDIFSGRLHGFFANYESGTSLMAATYPEAKRLEINLVNYPKNGYDIVNYGYHIFETWSNERELEGWTLSMATADLDQDGKNEVIVGDFNNNAYVFEHLTNNTFKRAYKTFDLNRTVQTDQSPYASELFAGISGTFNRTIFEHAELLIAGMDLNKNGQLEFIISTGTMIFVFESVRTNVNRIRDDTYQLIKIFDMYDEPALVGLAQEEIKITAMTWGDDITRDGRRELIVGVTNALLIFEIYSSPMLYDYSMSNVDPFNSPYYFSKEVFFGDTGSLLGKFDLPGNYRLNKNYIINAMLVDDMDRDGRLDLVYAGTDTSSARPLWSGFVADIEWDGATFTRGLPEDSFADMVKYNPINDLAVMDADYDDRFELVVGHKYGIDIYEYSSVDTVELRDVITSNPHYRLPERSYFSPSGVSYLGRDKDVVRLDTRPGREGFSNNNSIFMAYTYPNIGNKTYSQRLGFATSNDDGKTWKTWTSLSLFIDGGTGFLGIGRPSLEETSDGTIWLSISMRYRNSFLRADYTKIRVYRLLPNTNTWALTIDEKSLTFSSWLYGVYDPMAVTGTIAESNSYTSIFMLVTNGLGGNSAMYRIYSSAVIASLGSISWANDYNSPSNFTIFDPDLEKVGYNKYVTTFSGFQNAERRALDTDIYFAEANYNYTSGKVVFNIPQRTFSSAVSARYPSIIAERDTWNYIIAFEQPTLRPYGGLFAVWSNDEGTTWNGPYDMSHPLGLDLPFITAAKTSSGESYRAVSTVGAFNMKSFVPMGPVLIPRSDRGFTMAYTASFKIAIVDKNGVCVSYVLGGDYAQVKSRLGSACQFADVSFIASANNPWSNFTWYNIGEVSDLAVGDSDSDYRQEIFAASGKNAMLFEFTSNTRSTIRYNQVWTSPDYERDITQVAISDANGNGLPELIIESEKGVVNTFEVINQNPTDVPLLRPFNAVSAPRRDYYYYNSPITVDPFDVNGDGEDDIIVTDSTGTITAYDGITLSVIWEIPDNGTYSPFDKPNSWLLSTPSGIRLFSARNNTLKMINPYTGVVENSENFGGWINTLSPVDVYSGGTVELAIGLMDGTVILFDPIDWANISSFYVPMRMFESLSEVTSGKFFSENRDSLVVVGSEGSIYFYNVSDNSIIVNASLTYAYLYEVNVEAVDFNGDNVSEILLLSPNLSFAYSPSEERQLWNTTEYTSRDTRGVIYDVNEDGTPDIIMGSTKYDSYIFAIDGRNGMLLYSVRNISPGNLFWTKNPRLSQVNINGVETDVIIYSRVHIFSPSIGVTYLADAKSGVTIAGIEGTSAVENYVTTISDNPLPSMYVFDKNFTLVRYDLSDGPTDPEPPADHPVKLEPFIKLGDDFTSRTEYLLSDQFIEGTRGTDGWDDIFVVDDGFVGGADSNLLENKPDYNEAVWSFYDPGVGTYMGGAQIVTVGKFDTSVIIVPFKTVVLTFDAATGEILAKWEYGGDYNVWDKFTFEAVDWDGDNLVDIVYSRSIVEGGVQRVEYGWFANGDMNPGPTAFRQARYFDNPIFEVMDINLDGQMDMITYAPLAYHPAAGNFSIISGADFSVTIWAPSKFNPNDGLVILFPITNLVSNSDGKRIYFTLDYSIYANPSLPVDFSVFPSIIFGAEWAGTTLGLASGSTVGISPLPGGTSALYNVNNGTDDFLIGYDHKGNLYSLLISSPDILIPSLGTIDTLAVPYARKSILFGNFCGPSSFVMVTSATSVGCYDTFDFTTPPQVVWSADLDFDIIQDIVKGQFGSDGVDDLIITSKSGYVWILNSKSFQLGLSLLDEVGIDQPIDSVQQSSERRYDLSTSMIYVVLATAFVTNVVLLQRRKKAFQN